MNKDPNATIPKGRVATLLGGVAVVVAGLAAWWIGLNVRQTRKEERDPTTSAFVPTWEYRILQAQRPETNVDKPATLRQSDAESAQHSAQPGPPIGVQTSPEAAEKAVPDAAETESGQAKRSDAGPNPGPQPTPQRTRDDDTVYTKVQG